MSGLESIYLMADGQTVYLGCELCKGHNFADFVAPDIEVVLAAARLHVHDVDPKPEEKR